MKEDSVLSTFLRLRLRLERLAGRIVGDEDEARDVVQDSFVALWSRYRRAEGEEAERLAFRVVRNESISLWRKQRPTVAVDDELPLAEDDRSETLERIETVWRIVDERLSPLLRETLRRYELQGQSVEEIAAETGRSIEAVRKNLGRARMAIRNIYIDEYEDK